MKKSMRHLTFLLLAMVSTTMAWAGSIATTGVTGGTLAFYSDEVCATILDVTGVTAGSTVYIKATPDATHALGTADNQGKVSFITAGVTTSAMESRPLGNSDVTAPLGSFLDVWRVSDGIYRFTMPDDANLSVSVSAVFPVKTEELTDYLDASGTKQTVMARILTGAETTIGTEETTTWYVAKTTTSAYTGGLTLVGNVNIILADGATMTVGTTGNPVSGNGLYSYGGNIGIYGQSTGNNQGCLSIVADGDGIYAEKYESNSGAISVSNATVAATGNIGLRSENDLTISGSTVTTTGTGEYGIHAHWGNFLINNGSHVIAHGNQNGIFYMNGNGNLTIDGSEVEAVMTGTEEYNTSAGILIDGTVLLTNAIVTATGNRGIYSDYGVTISGGQVTATGTLYEGIYAYNSGDINIGWTAATDFIRASSYYGTGTVKIADGQHFVAYTVNGDETETATALVSGTVSDLTTINSMTLRPLDGYIVTTPDGVAMTATREEGGTTVKVEPITIGTTPYYIYKEGDQVTLTVTAGEDEVITSVSYSDGTTTTPVTATNGVYSFTMPANDITIGVSKVHPVTLTFAAGQQWTTWCDDIVWQLPAGLKVYTAGAIGSSVVTMNELSATVTTGDRQVSVIPAYTPVLLYRSDATAAGSYLCTYAAKGTPGSNVGNDGVVSVTADGFTFCGTVSDLSNSGFAPYYTFGQTYMLSSGKFYQVESNNGVKANKCWLNMEAPSSARLEISFGETTSLTENGKWILENYEAGAQWYTLDGRQLDRRPATKGLYIYGGRKVAVK